MTELNVVSYRPEPAEFAWAFAGSAKPVASVRPGDVLELFSEDCFAGKVRTTDDHPSRVCRFPFLNPVTGPFYVEGAEPGDTLALHFIEIEPARDWAVSSTFPHFGALTSTNLTATLQPPLDERVWVYDVDRTRRTVTFHAHHGDYSVELPLEPMHGTVGVAPGAFEARATITPDAHGGNMDTPEMRVGTTAYFGVNVAGALFGLGDGHCRQGQGEVCGVGVESAMNTVVVVDLIKGVHAPWPRLEDDDYLMSTGSVRPLEDAYRVSQRDLILWVAGEYRMDMLDAYQLLSQVGESPVGNVVDTNYTFVAKAPKRYLPSGGAALGGVHARLREQAAAYRAERR